MRLIVVLCGLVLFQRPPPVSAQAAEPPFQQGTTCELPPSTAQLLDEQGRIEARLKAIAFHLGQGRAPTKQGRRELAQERVRLEARNRFLAQQRALAEQGQCMDGLLPERARRAALQQIEHQILALRARASAVPCTVPFALTLAAGIPTLALAVGALFKWYIDASANDGAPDEIIEHDRRVNRTLGIVVAPLAALTLASAIWLGMRNSQRRAILSGQVPLEQERKRIEATFAPDLGPTSLGLSLRARF
jgi:hypothetical protein